MNDSVGPSGLLAARLVRADGREVHHPSLGALFERIVTGGEDALRSAADYFQTTLIAHHIDANGQPVDHSDTHRILTPAEAGAFGVAPGGIHLGSGLVTNVGVNLMAWNDTNNTLGSTLSNLLYHAIGTGATAAAATDFYLQTANGASNLSGTTNGYMTGALSVQAPNQFKNVATFTATGNIAVGEWGLTMSNAAAYSRTATGTPTSTTFPDSGAAFATAGNGLKGWTIEIASSALNTPTTTVQGLVTSNTATQLNLAGGWYTLANAGGSTPGANVAYVVYPTMWDHKVFSTINLANGDSLAFTYLLTIASGG